MSTTLQLIGTTLDQVEVLLRALQVLLRLLKLIGKGCSFWLTALAAICENTSNSSGPCSSPSPDQSNNGEHLICWLRAGCQRL